MDPNPTDSAHMIIALCNPLPYTWLNVNVCLFVYLDTFYVHVFIKNKTDWDEPEFCNCMKPINQIRWYTQRI